MDLSSVVVSFSSPYTLKPGVAVSRVNGLVTEGAPGSSRTVRAMVQPADGAELDRQPDGTRVDELIVIFTADLIEGANEETGKPPDVLVYEGHDYEVQGVKNWGPLGNFLRAVGRRVDPR